MEYLMAVDCGSTVCKVVIFSESGKEIASGSAKPETLYPRPGWTERNVHHLWQQICIAIRNALADSGLAPQAIAGITVTGHGNGIYCFDRQMQPSRNGILSVDSRTSDTLATLAREGTRQKAHPITANQLWPASAPVLLRWIKDHEPEVYEQTRHICMVKDYIRYRLTGEFCTDHTDFTGGALADTSNIRYDKAVLEAYGIPEVHAMLPPMLDSWSIGGKVTPSGAREAGLAEGTPVAVGGMDICMTVLGCGCLNEGDMCIIAGTWSINGIITEKCVIHPEVHNSFTHSVPDRWYLCDASPSSAANLDWFVDQFCYWEKAEGEKRGLSPFEIVNEEIAGMDARSCDILFHPFIYGSNVQAKARAGFYGLGAWHKRSDLLRAVFEGVCFSHLHHVQKLRSAVSDKAAYIAGGGKRSEIWTQIFADVLNTPIRVPQSDELGALGCAMTAAVAVGIYPDHREAVARMCSMIRNHEPDSEAHEIYMKKYEGYKKLLDVMKMPWDHMHQTALKIKGKN